MNEPRDIFCDVLVRVIEGQSTPGDHETFRALLKTHPEFWALYREQMRLHALLQCASAEGAGSPARQRKMPRAPEHRRSGWWRGAAAAGVLLAVGAAAKFGAHDVPPPADPLPASPARSVRLVRQVAAAGLELPQTLPGTVRLASGLAQVRLPSGVELSLTGPLEVEAESGMEIRLTKGQLLAWVPKRASGFTVHAPGLTAWDIGTVFSVTAEPRVSRLFVFKGSVQVLDGEGEGVGLCEAGQGVLAEKGRPAEVFDSDEENARRLFAKVRGDAALTDPETALAAAGLIADFWVARYAPVMVRRSAGNRPQQEEGKINQSKTMAVITAAAESEDQSGSGVSVKRAALAALLLTAMPLAQTAEAAGFTWLPQTGSNDWSVAENWTPAGPPGASNILDTATIPAAATGVINYDVAGSTFSNLNVQTTGSTSLTIIVNAPLFLDAGAIWGSGTGTGLHTVVTSTGSITSRYTTSSYAMTLNGGRFDVEAGGTMMVNRDTSAWNAWKVNGTKVTLRGAVMMPGGRTFTGTSPTLLGENTSLTLDGGSLDTDALVLGHNCNVLFTANGGRLCTQLTGGGISMGGAGNYTYLNYLTLSAGAITNDARFIAGYANTWGGENHTAGRGVGGIATVTLSGGTFVQRGYTAVGNGRVGNMVVSGTVFRAANDFYIGGGDYLGALVPNANIVVSGRVSIASGSLSVTNAPETQSSTSVANKDGSSQSGAAQFYIAESTQLWTGQRIVFTNLSAEITGLSTGVTYYVKMFRWNNNAKCFNVAAYPGPLSPSLGTATGGSAQWQTFPAMLSVGNTATFSDGTRLAPGTLDLAGGSLLVDQLVATNGIRSVVRFSKGSLTAQVSADIANGVPFVAGNGADAAVLALAGTARFADGLVVNTNATLAVGGTNAVGTVAVTGNVTLRPDAVLDVDFNAATNDCLTVDGNVTLPGDVTLALRPMDMVYPALMPVIQVTGEGSITGTATGWPKVELNGVKYKAVVSGNQLLVQKIAQGTLMSVY